MNQLAPSAKLRLENQVAVVTGGARGIRAGIVRSFVEEGARVVAGQQQVKLCDAHALVVDGGLMLGRRWSQTRLYYDQLGERFRSASGQTTVTP